MNWAAMTSREVRSYAPLHAATDLEKVLVLMIDEDARNEEADDGLHAELSYALAAQEDAEAKLESLKDDLFAVLNDEDGDNAHLLKRVREVLDNA